MREAEKQLRLLVFKLSLVVNSQDPVLSNNLEILRKLLRQGDDILQLNPLVADISNRIKPLINNSVSSNKEIPKELDKGNSQLIQQIYLLHELLLVLLENINFPSAATEEIKKISDALNAATDETLIWQLISGMTALAQMLDDVFSSVKRDQQKVELYLKQVNIDLQDLDEGITESTQLQSEKIQKENSINSQIETQIDEMENLVADLSGDDQIKQGVKDAVSAMRSQMEMFKSTSTEYEQQTTDMLDRLHRQISFMETQYEELKKQVSENKEPSLSDPVTGIRNRLAYDEAIYLELERFKRYGRPFTVLMFDLDHFKQLNNEINLPGVGDQILHSIATTMAANIRSVDFLARYDDDEFVIILPELGREDGKRLGAKICKAIADKSFSFGRRSVSLTMSGGVATIKNGDNIESLVKRVDTALCVAKEKGRNRCEAD